MDRICKLGTFFLIFTVFKIYKKFSMKIPLFTHDAKMILEYAIVKGTY